MVRTPASLLLVCICIPLWGQEVLQIRVVEGEGVAYTVGSRATRGITAEVSNSAGMPVEGATVRFELPARGPSGTFPLGERSTSMITSVDGRAEVWGMQWNREAGPLELRITASKGALTATAKVALALTSAPIRVDIAAPVPGRSRKKLWIALIAAGAAGVAVAGLAGKSSASAGAASVNPPQIGTPTISIGRP